MLDFECASLCDFALSSGWLGQDILAVVAGNDRLGMAEDYVCFVTSSTSDIHEIGVWSRHQSFQFVALSLLLFCGIQEISIHQWPLFNYYIQLFQYLISQHHRYILSYLPTSTSVYPPQISADYHPAIRQQAREILVLLSQKGGYLSMVLANSQMGIEVQEKVGVQVCTGKKEKLYLLEDGVLYNIKRRMNRTPRKRTQSQSYEQFEEEYEGIEMEEEDFEDKRYEDKFNNCPKHALKLFHYYVSIKEKLVVDSLEAKIWGYFLEQSKKNGTKLLLKRVFQNPLSIPENKRGKFLNNLLQHHELPDILEAQENLKAVFLNATKELNFESIVEKRSFKRKHEVLLTVTDILENLKEGMVSSKITKKKIMKEEKEEDNLEERQKEELEREINNSDDFLYDLLYGNP